MNNKSLALVVLAAVSAADATAADLSSNPAAPAYFAKEIIASAVAPRTLATSASPATRLNWGIGYSFSVGEVRHGRVACTDNLVFDTGTTVASSDAGSASIGAINGLGTSVLTFSLTSTSAANLINASDVLSVSGDHAVTGTDTDVICSVALYDQPSQAQAGGSMGLIEGTAFSGTYLVFVPSYGLVATPTANTANVEAAPPFGSFIPAVNASLGHVYIGWDGTAGITYGLRDPDGTGPQGAPFNVDGDEIGLSELLGADTVITVRGDFGPTASAGSTPFDLAARARTWLVVPASALRSDSATYPVGNVPFADQYLQLHRRSGNTIHPSEYTATLQVASAQPGVYAVGGIAGVYLGRIVRNGTELQVPLAQVPQTWVSRLVLTNTGGTAHPYVIAVLGEAGNTIGTDRLTGTVPANGITVVDLGDVLKSFTGAPRATLNVTLSAPNHQVQGLYQIVNPDKGSISNHVLVRPGSN